MKTAIGIVTGFLLTAAPAWAQQEPKKNHPHFDYMAAEQHEVGLHRHTIPLEGIRPGFHQLHLTLKVSPMGEVLKADVGGDAQDMKHWPELEEEVNAWKYKPFEVNGKAVTAEVEEYLDLVPPERLPKTHVAAPAITPNSKIVITLERGGCYGTCPAYSLTISTEGIVFDGRAFVVARGRHTDVVSPDEVRNLARKLVTADFYSMDSSYMASVTDNPTYVLSLTVDGHLKKVVDYVGAWEGMPQVITELENEVDQFARSERWIDGKNGLVRALNGEKFDFGSYQAQVMLKEAATRGEADTVRDLLGAGVSLEPLPAPRPSEPYLAVPFEKVGWLTAAGRDPAALRVLIEAKASEHDQHDKDLALAQAADSGNLDAVRALIDYGANPNANLSALSFTESAGGMEMEGPGAGSILIYAAASGNPEVVREILRYHPLLEARDREGKTAMFAAAEYRGDDPKIDRVECVRLLFKAGANVNARDRDGNTPLHETFLTDVEEELLKLGANVNARNNDGETPIFTTVDDDAIPLFIKRGADLSVRNKQGKTVIEAAKELGPLRQKALRKAIEDRNRP